MANSGIIWIDQTFDFCVKLLIDVANIMGITYEEINVWIFCVIWPILSLIMFAEILRLRLKISIHNDSRKYWIMLIIISFLLNFFLIGYFLLIMVTGIVDQFSSSDPAMKIFFNIDFWELLLLLTFCLFLPIINMRLIYENYSINR